MGPFLLQKEMLGNGAEHLRGLGRVSAGPTACHVGVLTPVNCEQHGTSLLQVHKLK